MYKHHVQQGLATSPTSGALAKGVSVSRFPTLVLAASLVLGTAVAGSTTASAIQGTSSVSTQDAPPAEKPPKKWRKWEAPRGPFFNDPHRKEGHFRIESKVVQTINHTPKGSYIRIAV